MSVRVDESITSRWLAVDSSLTTRSDRINIKSFSTVGTRTRTWMYVGGLDDTQPPKKPCINSRIRSQQAQGKLHAWYSTCQSVSQSKEEEEETKTKLETVQLLLIGNRLQVRVHYHQSEQKQVIAIKGIAYRVQIL